MFLSFVMYGNKIYVSDKMSNLVIFDEEIGEVFSCVDDIVIYIY